MTAAAVGRDRPTGIPVADRRTRALGYAALALLSYVPLLFSDPGKVAADTKQYLYLDPTRLLERAGSMWDMHVGLGTVTHQNIGYLFPMGPYYWVMDVLGVPDWVAQRLWSGSILFFAGLGVLYLLRTLHVRGPGVPVAAVVFMLNPYSLDYAARMSALLLPWAALPWMLALVIRALRDGGWRYPAIFAVVVQVVGGVNATSLIFAGVAPVLWIPYAIWVSREVTWRRGLVTTLKIGGLTILLSLWWIAGLSMQAGYGLDILKYTETVRTVAAASVAAEIFRGLGYWFFYGRDKLGPWIESAQQYTQWIWLILVGYVLPTGSLVAAAFTRWRHRVYFALLLVVGLAIAVGAHPYANPSPFGAVMKAFANKSSAGLALRSTGRAVPLVILSLAVFLGVGITALATWWMHRARRPTASVWWSRTVLIPAAIFLILGIVNFPGLFAGTFYGKNLERPEDIPDYWRQAAAALDAQPHDTRVLEIPGSDFASYRWGNLVDPLTPGIMDRPYVARELIPWGSPGTANLVNAFDRQLQEGVLNPNAIAPVSRLLAAGDIVARYDLQVDRFGVIRPLLMAQVFHPVPNGLGSPVSFGTGLGPALHYPLQDELALGLPANLKDPAPVVIYPVLDAKSIVRAQPAAGPLLLAGDGEGVVEASAVGLVTNEGLVLYSASNADDPEALRKEVAAGASLLITDSNRKQARRWSTVRDNTGYTERADETAVEDPTDARLELFPGAGTDAYTTAEQEGGAIISASSYGNPVSYTPEDRAVKAMDGDLQTAWRVGAFSKTAGEWLRMDFDHPITTDHVSLVQPVTGSTDRFITAATLQFTDQGRVTSVPISFDTSSRSPAGQTFTFGRRTFDQLKIIIDADSVGTRPDYVGASAVGFAEVRVRDDAPGATDVHVKEVVHMPTDLTKEAGAASIANQLTVLMTRERVLPVPPRADPELQMIREFRLATARMFGLGGVARLEPAAPSPVLDTLLGSPDAAHGGLTVDATLVLPGSINSRPSQAVDGDPSTAWQTTFDRVKATMTITTPAPVTFDHLDLRVFADGRHSVPTELTITAGNETRTVEVPPVADRRSQNASVAVTTAPFAPLRGSEIKVRISEVRKVKTLNYYSNAKIVMPVAIAELGIAGVQRAPLPENIPDACRSDLLTIDGRAVPIRVSGTVASASTLQPLDVQPCDGAIDFGAGAHRVETAIGRDLGVDIDNLTFASAPGGAAHAPGAFGAVQPETRTATAAAAPAVTIGSLGSTEISAAISGPTEPFVLVLGESNNAGWEARVDGKDLGPSRLVNGYANGWRVGALAAGDHTVELVWTPQTRVWWSLILSALGMLGCLIVIGVSFARRRTRILASVPSSDAPATLRAPWMVDPGARPARPLAIVLATLGVGVAGAALIRPWAGLVLAAVTVAGLVWPRGRALPALGAPVTLALAGLYIAAQQWRYHYPPLFEWPTFFEKVHVLGWFAAAFVAVDAVIDLITRPRVPEGAGAAGPSTAKPTGDAQQT